MSSFSVIKINQISQKNKHWGGTGLFVLGKQIGSSLCFELLKSYNWKNAPSKYIFKTKTKKLIISKSF